MRSFRGELSGKKIGDFTKQIDFDELSLDKRVQNLHEILNTTEYKNGRMGMDKFFEDYFNTEDMGMFMVSPNTNGARSDNDFVCRQLEFMANYLLYSRENLQHNDECSYPIETDNTKRKHQQKNSSLEGKKETNPQELERELRDEKLSQYLKQTAFKIEEEDLEESDEIRELQDYIMMVRKKTIEDKKIKDRIKEGTATKSDLETALISSKDRITMGRLMTNAKHTQLALKTSMRQPISFNNVESGRPRYTFWDNTGYYDANGEYVLISENKLELSNYKHVYQLIKYYSGLKEVVGDDVDSDWRYLLWELEYLIDNTPLNDSERDIMVWVVDGVDDAEILERLGEKYGLSFTRQWLLNIYMVKIPKMIVETFLDDKIDWFYTHKIRGKYKRCSKCKKVKLALTRYYSPMARGKFGLQATCRLCR